MSLDLEIPTHFRNFDWEKMKVFYLVAKAGSFVGGGRYLNLGQPSASRHVADLETHLGSPLFTRHKDGVRLTRKGEELLEIIEPTFRQLVGFTRKAHTETRIGKKRRIRIASTHAIVSYILKDFIFNYNRQNCDVLFELISNDTLLDIVLNDVDVAIRPYDSEAQGVCQDHLFTLEKRLYASSTYLERHGEPLSVNDLKSHFIISPARPQDYPYSDLEWILGLGLSPGKHHEPVFTSNSLECLVGAAEEGMGIIGGYKQMTIIKNSNLKNILPHLKGIDIKQYLIYPTYLKNDKEILKLKSYLSQALKDL